MMERSGLQGVGERWVLVLAGGDGTRLREVTERLYGRARPKQFCRFGGPRSLLEEAVERGLRLAPQHQVVVVTTRRHRADAWHSLLHYPEVRLVVQPEDRDTLPALALTLGHLMREVPEATLLVLPSDHHVADEEVFATALDGAAALAEARPKGLALVGAAPGGVAGGMRWLLTAPGDEVGWQRVRAFRDELPWRHSGALVHTSVVAGRVATMAALLGRYAPWWWCPLARARLEPRALEEIYRTLPAANFSREIVEGGRHSLAVVPLQGAGWFDLDTPERLMQARSDALLQRARKIRWHASDAAYG